MQYLCDLSHVCIPPSCNTPPGRTPAVLHTALSPELGTLPGTWQAPLTETQFQIEKQKRRNPRCWRPARSAHLTQAPAPGCHMAQASSSGVLNPQGDLVGWERVTSTQSSTGHLDWSGGCPLAAAASGSLEGEGPWRSPSLQRELKIAIRDDVIRFPQFSIPPHPFSHTQHTHTYTHSQRHRHRHKCVHTHTHTPTLLGEGSFWVPGLQGQESLVSVSACVCVSVCAWVCMSVIACVHLYA